MSWLVDMILIGIALLMLGVAIFTAPGFLNPPDEYLTGRPKRR